MVAKINARYGSVTSSPGGIACGDACRARYPAGAVVVLDATPAPGATFVGWAGACFGTRPCRVTMSGTRLVIAVFRRGPKRP
jgi:hypothetical protein